jgi:hypothetical protein
MTISIFAYTYLWAIFFISLFYSVGSLLLFLTREQTQDDFANLFIKLFLGVNAIIIVYATYKTKANSILLGALIIIVFAINSLKKIQRFSIKDAFVIRPKILFELLFVFTAIFIFLSSFLYIDNQQIAGVYLDYIYFANLSDFINQSGVETNYIDYFSNNLKPQPYHYYEIWLNAFFSGITSISSLLTQQLISHSLFFVLVYLGFVAILKKVGVDKNIAKGFALLLPFFHGLAHAAFYPSFLLHLHYEIFLTNALTEPKLFPIYIFFIAALLALLNHRVLLAALALLSLSLVSISAAPGVLLSLFLFSLVAQLDMRYRKIGLKTLFATFLIAAFIFLFYYFNETFVSGNMLIGHHFDDETILSKTINLFTDFKRLKTVINIQAKTFFQILYLYFIPLIISAPILFKQNRAFLKKLFLPFIILIFSFSFSWAFIDKMIDSSQLYTVIANPFLNIVISLLFIYAASNTAQKAIKYAAFFLLLFLFSFPMYRTIEILSSRKNQSGATYSVAYKKEVSEIIKSKGSFGGFVTNAKNRAGIIDQSLSVSAHRYFLSYVKNGINILPLHHFSEFVYGGDSNLKAAAENMQRETVFSRFVENQKSKQWFKSIYQSRIDFIAEHKLEYLFVTSDAEIDQSIIELSEKIIIDSKSGEIFILLKKQ